MIRFLALPSLYLCLISSVAMAQVETNFSAGGAVRVGDSSTACDASIEGAIRFDADGADTIDYCNGVAWLWQRRIRRFLR